MGLASACLHFGALSGCVCCQKQSPSLLPRRGVKPVQIDSRPGFDLPILALHIYASMFTYTVQSGLNSRQSSECAECEMKTCVGYSRVESFCDTENSVLLIHKCMHYISQRGVEIFFLCSVVSPEDVNTSAADPARVPQIFVICLSFGDFNSSRPTLDLGYYAVLLRVF